MEIVNQIIDGRDFNHLRRRIDRRFVKTCCDYCQEQGNSQRKPDVEEMSVSKTPEEFVT